MESIPAWMQVAALVLGPTGGAWLGVKAALNGLRAGQRDIRENLHELHGKIDEHGNRLTALEVGCLARHPRSPVQLD